MREPHNRARGEVLLAIDGRERRLCVSLGALAELEAAFDAVSFADLGERLSQLSAADLLVVLSALTAGGGEPMTTAQLAGARIDPRAAASAVAQAFQAAFDEA
ncbi:MAG: GTA-gp10 family protein [Terricaulis sp.]